MSFFGDDALSLVTQGFWNATGEVYLRYVSDGYLAFVGTPPPPPGPVTGGVPSGSNDAFSPLDYWQRVKRRKEDSFEWREQKFMAGLDAQAKDQKKGK